MKKTRREVVLAAAAAVIKGCGEGNTIRDKLEASTEHVFGFAERTFVTNSGVAGIGTLVVSFNGERRDPRESNTAWMVVIIRGDHTVEFDDQGIDTKPLRRGDEIGFVRVVYEAAEDSSTRSRRAMLLPMLLRRGRHGQEVVVMV